MTKKKSPVYIECESGGKSKDELLVDIDSNGMFVSDHAKGLMSQEVWQTGKREMVKFARAKVSDLGFREMPTTNELWARIRDLGHSLCEPYDGPALRIALKDEPEGDVCLIAMEQIISPYRLPRLMGVGPCPEIFVLHRYSHNGERILNSMWVDSLERWPLRDHRRFMFRLSK